MVSLWPWKGDDSSPSSFEKTLSTLSNKISNTQAQLDRLRSNSRRIKVLWTLYLAFAYLVYAIVLTLVVGWKNLGPWEWTGVAGGPVLIYLIRTLTNAYFSFRIETVESRLKDYKTDRTKTIQKLKDATKYDSTLELLEKYGGSGEKRNQAKKQDGSGQGHDQQLRAPDKNGRPSTAPESPGGRINIPPPPTANIQRPPYLAAPDAAQHHLGPNPLPRRHVSSPVQQYTEEFAPNAGPLPHPYPQYDVHPGPPRWYDRIMDLMLGEDEMAPKNRMVLICKKCRLVNGQAPPGTKSLADLGTWKCMSCGTLNGEIDEGKKIIREVLGSSNKLNVDSRAEDRDSDLSSDIVKVEDDSEGVHDTDGEERRSSLRLRNKTSRMVP
ncbi:uncharacterized protein F4822DRAFT_388407 [Hypoxylon trugodes]|uniref:uncharacterized protein n=1 Tax=Hypoxylon trugodes TaxID=326681 RepID=UPI00219C231E|nr:uncharacterized protein F4822DRAFT_388407 [Hypoxylon trugodes]KAI1391771.1 hypothetical protein F4822DRAFT_388407 [Hypoxylon trugodes]